MHGYKGFYNGKQADIFADSLYDAKQKAIAQFKAPKSKHHMVSVVLCETDVNAATTANGAELKGTQVVHSADF